MAQIQKKVNHELSRKTQRFAYRFVVDPQVKGLPFLFRRGELMRLLAQDPALLYYRSEMLGQHCLNIDKSLVLVNTGRFPPSGAAGERGGSPQSGTDESVARATGGADTDLPDAA